MLKKFINRGQKRKKLKTNTHIIYSLMAFCIIGGFAFFYTSKVFIADTADILNTEVGEEFKINNTSKFTINEWIYDEATSKMQVTLITSNLTDHLSDLKFVSVARSNLKQELPVKIVYNTRDIYIVMIDDVPKNFEQVVLRLVEEEVDFEHIFALDGQSDLTENEQAEIENKIIASIYTDQRLVEAGEVKQQKVKEYAFKVTNEMITDAEKNRQLLMQDIQKNTLIIARIKEEIGLLKQELIYQTIEEQDVTNSQIYNLESQIDEYENKNSEILVNVDSVDSKIERLIQRKRDLQF